MDPASFVSQARELYLGQFRAFVAERKQLFPNGAPERKYVFDGDTPVFRKMYCLDFGTDDGDPQVGVDLLPSEVLDFAPITGNYGAAALAIDHFRWDDVLIHHDAPGALPRIDQWFVNWFDPESRHRDPQSDVESVIHWLLVQPGKLSADMGTAPVDAFWHLLDVLEAAGAKSIRITASRDEVADG